MVPIFLNKRFLANIGCSLIYPYPISLKHILGLADQQCAQLCSEGKIVLLFGVVTLKMIVLNNATKSRLNLKCFLRLRTRKKISLS